MAHYVLKNTPFANANTLVEQLAEDVWLAMRQYACQDNFLMVCCVIFIDSSHECHGDKPLPKQNHQLETTLKRLFCAQRWARPRCRAVVMRKNHWNLACSVETDC